MNPLDWMIQFALGCHHRHVSRVFTINKRTCGTSFAWIADTNLYCRMVAPQLITASTRTSGHV
jgi:hypothetical protein